MRAFLAGVVFAGASLIVVGSCALDGDGTGATLGNGQGNAASTSGGFGGQGHGTPCDVREDCPADADCVAYACSNGYCAPSFAPAGSEVPGSAQGDCKKVLCTAQGTPSEQIDDTDRPAADDCHVGDCANGVPAVTPKEDGATCGAQGDLECLNGVCVGCDAPSDCNAGQCEDPVCNASNRCTTTLKASGFEVNDASSTDCVHDVCDGTGGVLLNVADGDDMPSDGNQCTSDSCSGAIPAYTPVMNGNDCSMGGVHCYNGVCSECGVIQNCPDPVCQTPVCTNGACGTTNDADGTNCGVNQHCYQGSCMQCGVTGDCPTSTCVPTNTCNAGTCMPTNAMNGTSCGSNQHCFNGTCSQCGIPADCPAAPECMVPTCPNGTCGMMPASNGTSCGSNKICCAGICCGSNQICNAQMMCQ